MIYLFIRLQVLSDVSPHHPSGHAVKQVEVAWYKNLPVAQLKQLFSADPLQVLQVV